MAEPASDSTGADEDRRTFLTWLSSVGMIGGMAAAYGTLAAFMGRFLYPSRRGDRGWMYVTEPSRLAQGESLVFRSPGGAAINIARQGRGDQEIIALSSTCPHLGCQVHWEGHNNRFFCPCHNGVFDPSGKAIDGPPAEAGQSLPRYPLKVEKGLLYIELPTEEVARGGGRIEPAPPHARPGHDPCLGPRPSQES